LGSYGEAKTSASADEHLQIQDDSLVIFSRHRVSLYPPAFHSFVVQRGEAAALSDPFCSRGGIFLESNECSGGMLLNRMKSRRVKFLKWITRLFMSQWPVHESAVARLRNSYQNLQQIHSNSDVNEQKWPVTQL
jgi:hypothetical protein